MKLRHLITLLFLSGVPLMNANGQTSGTLVLSSGVPGQNTRGAIQRIESDVISKNPDLVVLCFGMNDALNSHNAVPLSEFRENLETIVKRIIDTDTRCVLVTLHPVLEDYLYERHPRAFYGEEGANARLLRYSEVIREIATTDRIPCVDWSRDAVALNRIDLSESSIVYNEFNSGTRDGLHLTAEGYRFMAQSIAREIRPLIPKDDTSPFRILCFGDSLTYGSFMKGAGTTEGDTYPARLQELLRQPASHPAAKPTP